MALELPLLPETLPEDVEDVSWGLQTAAALWSRGDKSESVVWLRRAAEAARGAGHTGRAQTLLKSASELEALLAASPPSSVRPSDEPLRVLPPVGSGPVAPASPLAAMASPPRVAPPPPLERNVTQEIEDFESLDPEAAEDLFSEEETHELGAGEPLPNKPLSAAPAAPPPPPPPPPIASAPPATPAVVPPPPAPPAPAPSAASAPPAPSAASAPPAPAVVASAPAGSAPPSQGTPAPAEVIITTKPDGASRSTASQKKRQREPILDPWSDDMPPSDPPPRTQHHRPDMPGDDDDVLTSAPVLDVSLKRKPPPPPPKPRSQTLTGQPIPSGTVLAAVEASPESVRAKVDSPAPSAVDGRPPPPPPTRKPTTPSMQAVSFPSVPSAGPEPAVVNAPPPPSRERKSVPPPPPARPPLHTQPLAPDAPVASPAPPDPSPPAPRPSPPAPPSEVKSEPPPPTMPAAQQRQSRPDAGNDLLSAIDLPKESLPKEPLSAADLAEVAAAEAPAPARAPSVPPPPPRAPSRPPPPPRPASAPPPPPTTAAPPSPPPRPPSAPPAPAIPTAPPVSPPAPAVPTAPPVSPPAAMPSAPPAPAMPTAPPVTRPRASTIPPAQRSVGGLSLEQVEVFSDLSGEIQKLLCEGATIVELGIEEEVAVVGAAIVLTGAGAVCPTVADAAASHLAQAALVPGLSTLAEPTRIRIVATAPASIASWDRGQLETALKSCPWVLEDLQRLGDRLSALAGATMGALGDLDEGSRLAAFERLTLRVLAPGEVMIAAGGELGGLNVVGAGAIVVAKPDGAIEYSVGDVVLPETVLEGGTTAGEVRAGPGGALLLSASRMVTVELFSILPSLIELLR